MGNKKNFFNEHYYLDPLNNIDDFNSIIKMRKYFMEFLTNNSQIYDEIIKCYNKYVELIALLVKEISLPNNSISVSLVLNRLLYKGYFSYNEKIASAVNRTDIKEIIGFYGLNVPFGYVCCRHVADFYKNVFDKMNLDCIKIHCLHDDDITREEAFNEEANHVVNLIKYNNMLYVYDLFNNAFFCFEDELYLKRIFSDKFTFLYYKPYMDMIVNGDNFEDIVEKLFAFNIFSKRDVIDIFDFREISIDTDKKFEKNKSLIRDFRSDSRVYVSDIYNALK